MEILHRLPPWQTIAAVVVIAYASIAVHRLFFHPLSRFPGPKLAALTRWYEAYYDVVQNGQYTFKIAKMHEKYGPIIRISPYELHVNDPSFFNQLYCQEGRYNKYDWIYEAFGVTEATIITINHDIHHKRRQPLNPFFSKAKVVGRQDMIHRNVKKLCNRLSDLADSKTRFNLGAAITAYTREVASEYIFHRSYGSLDQDDFYGAMTTMGRSSGVMWRVSKHIRWYGPAIMSIPTRFTGKAIDDGAKSYIRHMSQMRQDAIDLLAAAAAKKGPRTIVHGIYDSGLPPSDKTPSRITKEVSTLTVAGFETSASVLRLIFYHVFSNAEILQKLRTELSSLAADSYEELELRDLERLPYLTGVLMEGLRLSPGLASRLSRVAPDTDLVYDKWNIPAGTPIGMTVLLMHLDEKVFPDPLRFQPDRWTDLDQRRRLEKSFAPFLRGPRQCLGLKYVEPLTRPYDSPLTKRCLV